VAQFESERLKTNDAVWRRERELNLRLKGRMEWPGRGNVVETFGLKRDSRTGLSTRSNGINIAVSKGAKVVAPAAAQCYISAGHAGWNALS